jgi:hypothetical protein
MNATSGKLPGINDERPFDGLFDLEHKRTLFCIERRSRLCLSRPALGDRCPMRCIATRS